ERIGEAFASLRDFVQNRERQLLIIENQAQNRSKTVRLLRHADVQVTTAHSGETALEALREKVWDCVVLDLNLADNAGFELLADIQRDATLRSLPIVSFSSRDLSTEEEEYIRAMSKSI